MKKIILASASPRRRELLAQIGFEFTVVPSDVEENPVSTLPQDMVIELSKEKARDVWEKIMWTDRNDKKDDMSVSAGDSDVTSLVSTADHREENDVESEENQPSDSLVLSADTVVSIDGEILGKPKDEEDAARMLELLSGKEHQVYTGVTMIWLDEEEKRREYSFYVCTGVVMYRMSRAEILRYVRSGEPMDKAGAYGVQGAAAAYIKSLRGEYSNVVGLPVGRLYQEMKAWGLT